MNLFAPMKMIHRYNGYEAKVDHFKIAVPGVETGSGVMDLLVDLEGEEIPTRFCSKNGRSTNPNYRLINQG